MKAIPVKKSETQQKKKLRKSIHEKALAMKQLNAGIAEEMLNKILAEQGKGVSTETIARIKSNVMKEEVESMVAEMDEDVDEIVKGTENESATLLSLTNTMQRLDLLYRYAEKKPHVSY